MHDLYNILPISTVPLMRCRCNILWYNTQWTWIEIIQVLLIPNVTGYFTTNLLQQMSGTVAASFVIIINQMEPQHINDIAPATATLNGTCIICTYNNGSQNWE